MFYFLLIFQRRREKENKKLFLIYEEKRKKISAKNDLFSLLIRRLTVTKSFYSSLFATVSISIFSLKF